jgi:hypothetical protein
LLDPLTCLLFLAGLLGCLWHWRRPAAAFTLLWLGAGFAPAAVIGAYTMMLHAITAQAVVFVLPALAVGRLAQFVRGRVRGDRQGENRSSLRASYIWSSFVVLLLVTAFVTYRDYFDVWANDADTRAIYFSNARGVMDYLRQVPFSGPVSLSSPFPGLPHDPFNFDLHVRRDDIDLRWFDAREALVFPRARSSLLVLPANARPDPLFAEHLPMAALERHVVRDSDVDPYFDTATWDPQATLASWLAGGALTRPGAPLNFGGAIELIAYSVVTPRLRPGEIAITLTFWRIVDPAALGPRHPSNYAREAQIFLHILDSQDTLVSGSDRLHAPAWNWHTGEVFAQIHRAVLPPDLAPGDYTLKVGLYTLPDLVRLTGPDFDAFPIGAIAVQSP